MSELAGVEMFPLSSITLSRKIVQRSICVVVNVGSSSRFAAESQSPSWGGGRSLSGSESGATPTLLSRKVESSTIRCPPAFVLDQPSALRSTSASCTPGAQPRQPPTYTPESLKPDAYTCLNQPSAEWPAYRPYPPSRPVSYAVR